MEELRVLSPTAILGYGYPMQSFQRGVAAQPQVIAVDAGSTDPGPYYLGSGKSFTQRSAVKRDLRPILLASKERDIPVLIGSAGGSGARPHLDWLWDIIMELYEEEGFRLKTAALAADIDKEAVKDALRNGLIEPCGPVPPLTESVVDSCTHLVAQMGTEPFLYALNEGYQVIVAGRAYDPAPFAAVPILAGFDPGLALHMGKILECAAIAADPGSGADCMLGTITSDSFCLEPMNAKRACTRRSVAAHTLYEKSNPYLLPGPGGQLNLENTVFTAVNQRIVAVQGSRFEPMPYKVKLEGASPAGYRSVAIAGIRDPFMLEQLDSILVAVEDQVFSQLDEVGDRKLYFRCYGRDGVMGALEPQPVIGHEVGLVIEATAATQEQAASLCGLARSTLLHFGYPGRISTAGNLAFPFSPSDFDGGQYFRFAVHHLMPVEDAGKRWFAMVKEVV